MASADHSQGHSQVWDVLQAAQLSDVGDGNWEHQSTGGGQHAASAGARRTTPP